MALSAIVLAACSRLFLKLERKLQAERRYGYAVMFAAIGLPTFFLGIALSRWTFDQETLGWDMTVPALAMLSLVAATLLNGRLISLVVAMLGMWAGASVFGSTTASLLALLFCGLGGSLHIDHASPI
ncbi:MAG: hypothetical protein P8J20_09120 [Novosphingobium sp.]|nr:hypothetical protein [Novosphingobium sp.]